MRLQSFFARAQGQDQDEETWNELLDLSLTGVLCGEKKNYRAKVVLDEDGRIVLDELNP